MNYSKMNEILSLTVSLSEFLSLSLDEFGKKLSSYSGEYKNFITHRFCRCANPFSGDREFALDLLKSMQEGGIIAFYDVVKSNPSAENDTHIVVYEVWQEEMDFQAMCYIL